MKTTESNSPELNRYLLVLSIPLITLLIGVSLTGLLMPEIYQGATENWLAQSVGQDAVDLFLVVPVLIVGSLYSLVGNRTAVALWVGTLMYLAYTFLIYCFAVRFNVLFVPYCLILGICLFSLIWFFNTQSLPFEGSSKNLVRSIGIYFIVVSVVFYALWMLEIIPATLKGEAPSSLTEAGLATNPVPVIDLSLFLPGTFIVGVLILKRRPFAISLIPVLLTFFVLMDLTIAALSVIMVIRGVGGSYLIAGTIGALAAASAALLVGFVRTEAG